MSEGKFDPDKHTVNEVVEELEAASPEEHNRIVAEELAGKKRKTVLEAAGADPNERRDASGRVLHPWEVSPAPREN